MPREKIEFALRMSPETQQLVKEMCPRDNCQPQNEFIEKTIQFSAGYISGQEATAYLSAALVAALRGTVQGSEANAAHLSNYVRYMATREGAQARAAMDKLVTQMETGTLDNPRVEELISFLSRQKMSGSAEPTRAFTLWKPGAMTTSSSTGWAG